MEGHLTKSVSELDRTDELPVLSEEAILKFRLLDTEPPDNEPPDTQPRAAEPDPLESSVDTLRQALDQAENRWTALESRLESQDRAIAELKASLGHTDQEQTQAALASGKVSQPLTVATADIEPEEIPGADHAMLERIASLESYIAGRADRWQEMEQELLAKTRRLTELETELEQRIARELQMEERLHDEGDRANELREKLRRMNRRLEETELGTAVSDLDATREMLGQAMEVTPIRFRNGSTANDAESDALPKFLCLSSDATEPYVMRKAAITVGRGPECDIQIITDYVSREHATIRRAESGAVIEDKSSTNGVFVNTKRVNRKTLADGDEITIGESRFRFVSGAPSE